MPSRQPVAAFLTTAALAVPAAAGNPPAPGFDLAGSDPEAVAVADAVMEAMGGRAAWDGTRYLTWNFFDRRRHVWDKATGDIRVEGTERDGGAPYLVLMNLESGAGRAWQDGSEVTAPDELAELLDRGEAAWINDSYWLFMPYKLKDSGVTLRHAGEAAMTDGRPATVLELTFEDVGRTPENRYLVYVGDESGLVEQWDFFAEAADTEPRFQIPWRGWRLHGRILLSADRGENAHTDVGVFDDLPRSIFESPDPVDWDALLAGAL